MNKNVHTHLDATCDETGREEKEDGADEDGGRCLGARGRPGRGSRSQIFAELKKDVPVIFSR